MSEPERSSIDVIGLVQRAAASTNYRTTRRAGPALPSQPTGAAHLAWSGANDIGLAVSAAHVSGCTGRPRAVTGNAEATRRET